jgi:hypothetical protein
MSQLTIAHTPAGFVVRCMGRLQCSCGEVVIANDLDVDEIPDGLKHDDKLINGLKLICSACHADLLEVSLC